MPCQTDGVTGAELINCCLYYTYIKFRQPARPTVCHRATGHFCIYMRKESKKESDYDM